MHPFVGAVEIGDEAGHTGPKGHPAGDIVDIGASADGQALAFPAAVLLIALGQDLEEGRVGGNMVGRVQRTLDSEPGLGQGSLRRAADGLLGSTQRVRLSNRPWQPVSCRVSMVKARVRGPERSSAWAMPRACPWWSPWGNRA